MRRIVASILISFASSSWAADAPMFPLPKGAIEPGHVVVAPGASEQDHFWLNAKYPTSSALDHYKRVFAKWRPCHARDDDWSSFGDRTSGRDQHIHQLMRHWVNVADDTSVVLILRYTSEGLNYRITPDNERQSVVLLRVKHANASKMLADMGVTCTKDS